jgi:RNA polymerase sigma-70 factor (ECF subfamily)
LPGPEHLAETKELGRIAQDAVAKMPAHHRAVLVLRAYHDLDYGEIADALEIEPGTVKSRLNRAREMLRHTLSGGGG